jgi:hypothetical protein
MAPYYTNSIAFKSPIPQDIHSLWPHSSPTPARASKSLPHESYNLNTASHPTVIALHIATALAPTLPGKAVVSPLSPASQLNPNFLFWILGTTPTSVKMASIKTAQNLMCKTPCTYGVLAAAVTVASMSVRMVYPLHR